MNLKNIQEIANTFNSLDEVEKSLRNIQTKKTRLKKQKMMKDYETKMTELLQTEQILKEVKQFMKPVQKPVTNFCQEDVDILNFDETIKAIKSIQSKKCNTQYYLDRTEYDKACEIEKMLLDHKKLVKPIEDTVIAKTELSTLINELENLDGKLDKDYILEQLKKMM